MEIALVTGSCGLIGSESVSYFSERFDLIIGIDNDFRSVYFGNNASVKSNKLRNISVYKNYKHFDFDVRDSLNLKKIFKKYGTDIKLIIHAAAQPSHDWSAKDPLTDFEVNAYATLNLLELTRKYCSNSVFIFTSTNKVYGDLPNKLPLLEMDSRYEIDSTHDYYSNGIDEKLSIDQSKHSLFGSSKLSADILTQEYGKYFGIKTGIFRGGCLTGRYHKGAELHGFLSYMVFCALQDKQYNVFGYKGKQVRDNISSIDLIIMFDYYYKNPSYGEVFNVGGGRFSNCSILEAFDLIELNLNKKINWKYNDTHRSGDHKWWISDVGKFKKHYPDWNYSIDLNTIILNIAYEIDKGLSK